MILASSSKQRKKLMEAMFNEFQVLSVDVDETFQEGFSLYENIVEVAFKKAMAVVDHFNIKDDYVIATDTVVYFDGKILLKPKDYDDAFNMIKGYEDKKQEVVSGFVFLKIENGKIVYGKKKAVVSYVSFNNLTDEAIKEWLKEDLYHFCSGGFMVEKVEKLFDMTIEGSYSNIIGLPLEEIQEVCKELHIETIGNDIKDTKILKKYM